MALDAPGTVVKVIELVGSSDRSFSDAVRTAVRIASQSLRNITSVEVLGSSADVGPDGEIAAYKVNCRLSFVVDSGRVDVADDDDDDDTPSGRELVGGGALTEDDLALGGHDPRTA